MNIKQSKIEGSVRFVIDNHPETLNGPFNSVFHLFEHEYDEDTRFWYAVAEVDCSHDELQKVMMRGMGSELSVLVTLSDGRMGAAKHLNSEFIGGIAVQPYTKMAISGWSQLCLPR